jgi:type II secretory pathway pseudopilin PulG
MTSRAGPRTRSRSNSSLSGRGVTLIELLLVLSLIVMLVGATVATFGSGRGRRRFLEASRRFETLFRMARAEAANEGRRLRVSFESSEGSDAEIRVLWEPDPLGEPEGFVDYDAVAWRDYIPASDDAVVTSARRIGDSAYRVMEEVASAGDGDESLQHITFYPDGSSDSAVVELSPIDENSALRAVLRLDGPTGTIQTFLLIESELEDAREAIEQGTYTSSDGEEEDD